MVSAYVAFYVIVIFHLPWPVGFGLAVLFTAVLGMLIDRGATDPLGTVQDQCAYYRDRGLFFWKNLALVSIGG